MADRCGAITTNAFGPFIAAMDGAIVATERMSEIAVSSAVFV